MNSLLGELGGLQHKLIATAASASPPTADASLIASFVQGMQRKCNFAMHHLRVIEAVDWARVDEIGREVLGTPNRQTLRVNFTDAHLEITHPQAVIEHVYIAADGLFAAVSNLTDTYARILNAVYGLGVNERRANLFEVTKKCASGSVLHTLHSQPVHRDWLERLRDLRGRCQHADVEHVLMTSSTPLSRRSVPFVPLKYCWQLPVVDTALRDYARAAVDAAESTLLASSRAIVASGSDPTK